MHTRLDKLFPIRPPAWPGGRWSLAGVILVALLSAFWACGVFHQDDNASERGSYGAALFFSVTLAYLVPVFGYITERTAAAFETLRPTLDVDHARADAWLHQVTTKPPSWTLVTLALALCGGITHNLLLFPSPGALIAEFGESAAVAATVVGTLLMWLVVTTVVSALLDNAQLLNRAAHTARVRPFDTRPLRPFATVAVISTLSLIGTQAAFPIMSIEAGLDPMAYIPGLLATGGPMILLAALPVWPVHRRLTAGKKRLLEQVDARLAALEAPDPASAQGVAEVAGLLGYRREITHLPEWPFDVGVLTRLGLYLIIPPLTWVGAALIENVVEAFL